MMVTPDLLITNDGSAADARRWPQRRQELYQSIIPHEYGGMPPRVEGIDILRRSQNRVKSQPGGTNSIYEVRVRFASVGEMVLTLRLWRPEGDGPFPVVLDGDGCWRYFDDQVARNIVSRGNIAASFDRTEAAADNKDAYRSSGLYRLFPGADFGVLSAWAWAYHRCVDALLEMDHFCSDGIAITGHSRGGKTALLAGATDDRIAITNPNGSGIGGASLHRLKAKGSERIDSFYKSGNIFWFGQGLKDYRNRDIELPYDQHFLHALVAPRNLLMTDAYEDYGANPAGMYAACQASRKVYEMLGEPQNIGWSIREGRHAHTPADYDALLDLMDRHLHGRQVYRDFQRPLFPQLDNLLSPA